MDIGIGLPNTLDIAGPAIADWARRAEERGFARLATIDRASLSEASGGRLTLGLGVGVGRTTSLRWTGPSIAVAG